MRGETELAIRLDIEADALQARFEEAFWVEDQRYYAIALDRRQAAGRRDRVERRASACGPGSSPPSRARAVADGCCRPAMFSGWGIRTYAAGQPGYNPIGYHTGHGLAARHVADRGRA